MASRKTEAALLAVILLVSALLLLANLGSPRLWQDEAETALLARNALKYGVPRVWDGRNLVAQYYALDFDKHLLFQKPWLPVYLVAGSFALLGESTSTARLPFALCGLMAVWLTWRAARRFSGSPVIALLSSVLLSVSLPLVLYSRQCRWYALAMVLTLLLIEAEERLSEKLGWLRLGLVSAALMHTNYLAGLPTLAGVLGGRALTRGRRSIGAAVVMGMLVMLALFAPFLLFFPPFEFAREAQGGGNLGDYLYRIAWVTSDFNRTLLPLPGLALLIALRCRSVLSQSWFRRCAILFAIAIPLTCLALWPGLVRAIGFRYVVNLLPVAAILLATVIYEASRSSRILLCALAGLHLGTYVLGFPLSFWPPKMGVALLRKDLPDAVRSVVSPVRGPVDAVVEFLSKNARSDEFFFTPYEQLPFQFYTDLRTVGLQGSAQTLQRLGIELPPYVSELFPHQLDWYLPRRDWEGWLGAPRTDALLVFLGPRGSRAERHILDAPDLSWQTREYPPRHVSRSPRDVPPVVIYRFPPPTAADVTSGAIPLNP